MRGQIAIAEVLSAEVDGVPGSVETAVLVKLYLWTVEVQKAIVRIVERARETEQETAC